MIQRHKKLSAGRCCWVCGRQGGAGYTAALKLAGYDVKPGEMAYAHPNCMGKAQRHAKTLPARGHSDA